MVIWRCHWSIKIHSNRDHNLTFAPPPPAQGREFNLYKEKEGKKERKGEKKKGKKWGGGNESKKLVKKFRLQHTMEIYKGEENSTQNFRGGGGEKKKKKKKIYPPDM